MTVYDVQWPMPDQERRYEFSWDMVGDLETGRPNLGPNVRLEVYRLMQFCLRDVLEQRLGIEEADRIFYESGKLAGLKFFEHVVGDCDNLSDFVSAVQNSLRELNIGIFRVEKADPESGSFVFCVFEDVDCSGLPDIELTVCTYDEGFIAGLMEAFTGNGYVVKEVDCWCTGDRTCRFTVDRIN